MHKSICAMYYVMEMPVKPLPPLPLLAAACDILCRHTHTHTHTPAIIHSPTIAMVRAGANYTIYTIFMVCKEPASYGNKNVFHSIYTIIHDKPGYALYLMNTRISASYYFKCMRVLFSIASA